MPAYLVRHARAGDKHRWSGPDAERPLDAAGLAQADALAEELASTPVHRILTSPTRRCRQTIEPLALRLGLPVEPAAELLPHGDSNRLRRLVTALDGHTPVICTHGELMRPLLAHLRHTGVVITAKRHDDDWLLQKGTGWALTLDPTGAIIALDHLSPHPLAPCPAHDPP